jgi:hypothetical protein
MDADPPIRIAALALTTPIDSPKISTNEAPETATSNRLTDETVAAL